MKQTTGFSCYGNRNINAVSRAATNEFIEEDNNGTFLAKGDSVAFSGNFKNIIYIIIKSAHLFLLVIVSVLAQVLMCIEQK